MLHGTRIVYLATRADIIVCVTSQAQVLASSAVSVDDSDGIRFGRPGSTATTSTATSADGWCRQLEARAENILLNAGAVSVWLPLPLAMSGMPVVLSKKVTVIMADATAACITIIKP